MILTPTTLQSRSSVSAVRSAEQERLQQYIDDAQTRIELYLPMPFPDEPDKQLMLAWVKLAESLALQDAEEYLAAVARGYTDEDDGAWSYTRQPMTGDTTGNPDVDTILGLWIRKQQAELPETGNIKAMLL